MVIRFDKEYLSDLYYFGKSKDKKHRFQPQVVRNYVKRVLTLASISKIEELYVLNSLNYEILKGDKKGISSIRIDKQYRLEFTVSHHDSGEEIINICSILDISNHYKT
ncbi:MAG: type II toxin-antitoxin system RelE/ParE family toxin [Proteiniphilum sp.]